MVNLKKVAKDTKIKLYKAGKNRGKIAVKKAFKTGIKMQDLTNDKDFSNADVFGNTISSIKEVVDTTKKTVNDTKTVYRGGKKVVKGTYNTTKATAKASVKVSKATANRSVELARKLAYKYKFRKNKKEAAKKSIIKGFVKMGRAIASSLTNTTFLAVGGIVIALLLVIVLLVVLCFSVFTGVQVMPGIEDKEAVIKCMQALDSYTGKQLVREYKTVGDIDEDWKAVLSLTLGKYNNDLSEVDMSVGESIEWTGSYADVINEASATYNIDSALICAVINAESTWRPNIVSSAGAKGLMQLIDSTFQSMCPGGDPFNPRDNIMAGTKYLRYLTDMLGEDLTLVTAGYNAGPGAVIRWGYSVPPYVETQNYVRKVASYYSQYKSGVLEPNDSDISGSITIEGSNFLSEAYDLVNEVNGNNKLTRNNFEQALSKMSLTEEQKELAEAIYEADLYDEIFGEGYDYKFNIIGSKVISADANGEANGVPLYLQYREPWASHPYSTNTIKTSGCGPTTMSMVASWAGKQGRDISKVDKDRDGTVNPIESADFATAQGYACIGNGSYNTVVSDYVKHIGCTATYTLDINKITEALSSNKLVVINVGGGVLSGGGHFMLGVGIKDGMIMLNDPGRERQCYAITGATYSPSLVDAELKNAWIIN